MQAEQVIATAIIAMQNPTFSDTAESAIAMEGPMQFLVAEDTEEQTVFSAPRNMRFSVVGRYSKSDSRALSRHKKECENFSKVFPGYPQPAIVTFRMNFSL